MIDLILMIDISILYISISSEFEVDFFLQRKHRNIYSVRIRNYYYIRKLFTTAIYYRINKYNILQSISN